MPARLAGLMMVAYGTGLLAVSLVLWAVRMRFVSMDAALLAKELPRSPARTIPSTPLIQAALRQTRARLEHTLRMLPLTAHMLTAITSFYAAITSRNILPYTLFLLVATLAARNLVQLWYQLPLHRFSQSPSPIEQRRQSFWEWACCWLWISADWLVIAEGVSVYRGPPESFGSMLLLVLMISCYTFARMIMLIRH